jgi:hypothetical protein
VLRIESWRASQAFRQFQFLHFELVFSGRFRRVPAAKFVPTFISKLTLRKGALMVDKLGLSLTVESSNVKIWTAFRRADGHHALIWLYDRKK